MITGPPTCRSALGGVWAVGGGIELPCEYALHCVKKYCSHARTALWRISTTILVEKYPMIKSTLAPEFMLFCVSHQGTRGGFYPHWSSGVGSNHHLAFWTSTQLMFNSFYSIFNIGESLFS